MNVDDVNIFLFSCVFDLLPPAESHYQLDSHLYAADTTASKLR